MFAGDRFVRNSVFLAAIRDMRPLASIGEHHARPSRATGTPFSRLDGEILKDLAAIRLYQSRSRTLFYPDALLHRRPDEPFWPDGLPRGAGTMNRARAAQSARDLKTDLADRQQAIACNGPCSAKDCRIAGHLGFMPKFGARLEITCLTCSCIAGNQATRRRWCDKTYNATAQMLLFIARINHAGTDRAIASIKRHRL